MISFTHAEIEKIVRDSARDIDECTYRVTDSGSIVRDVSVGTVQNLTEMILLKLNHAATKMIHEYQSNT